MQITKVQVDPYEKAIIPGICFDIEITYKRYDEAIIGVNGWLETNDGKVIAEIREEPSERPRSIEIGAKGSYYDKEFEKEDIYETALIAFLDSRALSYIEERRMKDRKGDVKLTLNLRIKTINGRAIISHIHEARPEFLGLQPASFQTYSGKKTSDWTLLIYAYDSEFFAERTNRWILSAKDGPVFLAVSEQRLKKEVTIKSSDWIHDFAPKLGLGEYFIIEIPKGKEIIKKAWSYVEKAEECFRKWDMKGVCDNCREAGKVLNKEIKAKFGEDSFTYNERWGRAYLRFFNYLVSLGLHLEDLAGKDWSELIKNLPSGFPHPKRYADYPRDKIRFSKVDAEHILIITKALVKYAEEILEENEQEVCKKFC